MQDRPIELEAQILEKIEIAQQTLREQRLLARAAAQSPSSVESDVTPYVPGDDSPMTSESQSPLEETAATSTTPGSKDSSLEEAKINKKILGLISEIYTYAKNFHEDMDKMTRIFSALNDAASSNIKPEHASLIRRHSSRGIHPGIAAPSPKAGWGPHTQSFSQSLPDTPRSPVERTRSLHSINAPVAKHSSSPMQRAMSRSKISLLPKDPSQERASTLQEEIKRDSGKYSPSDLRLLRSKFGSSVTSVKTTFDSADSTLTSEDSSSKYLPAQLGEFFGHYREFFQKLAETSGSVLIKPDTQDVFLQLNDIMKNILLSEKFTQLIELATRGAHEYILEQIAILDVILNAYPECNKIILDALEKAPHQSITRVMEDAMGKSFQCLMRYEILIKEMHKELKTSPDIFQESLDLIAASEIKLSQAVKACQETQAHNHLSGFRVILKPLLIRLEQERRALTLYLFPVGAASTPKDDAQEKIARLQTINDLLKSIYMTIREDKTIHDLLTEIGKRKSDPLLRGDTVSAPTLYPEKKISVLQAIDTFEKEVPVVQAEIEQRQREKEAYERGLNSP